MSLSTQLVRLSDIKKSNSELRLHPPAQRKKARHLFERHGIVAPVILDEGLNIVDGRLRFEIAQELGWKSLDCMILHGLTEPQKKELALSLNRLGEETKWDPNQLKLHLEAILEFEADLSFTGFEQAEIDNALSFQVIPDQEPEDLTPPLDLVSRVGDVWRIGDHLLICGDSLAAQDLLAPHMNEPTKLLCTDPPYNVEVGKHVRVNKGHSEFPMASGEMDDKEFEGFLDRFITGCLPLLRTEALLYIFMDWRHITHLTSAALNNKLIQQNLCVWAKTNGGMGSFYRSQHELIGVFSRSAQFQNNIQLGKFGRYRTNVWTYPGVTSFGATRKEDLADHPTVKPTQLVADIILDCTSIGDNVLDPFLGSGTTLLAAEQTKRRGIGIELDPQYVDVAIRRLQETHGLLAIHAETELSFEELKTERLSQKEAAYV
ncbi:DNA modification methylase [Rhodobacteraceae bacterium]|nr:DNA modification methylase [Paracoccaceae bacterium]